MLLLLFNLFLYNYSIIKCLYKFLYFDIYMNHKKCITLNENDNFKWMEFFISKLE